MAEVISLINENNEQLTETELLNNFKRNAKRYHGDFQTKRGVSFICVHDNSYLDDFYRIIKSTETRQGISLRNKDYFKRIMDAFGSAHRAHSSTYGVPEILNNEGTVYK